MNSLRRLAGPARYFSEGARRQAYTPIKKFDFQGRSSYTVLAQPQRSDSEKGMGIKAIPYEIKESTFKNALGVFMGECFEFMLPAASGIGPVVMLGFALNYFYRMSLYLGRTVVQVDMQSNGSAVTFKTLLGQEHSFDLENVLKMKDEKALVETFEEPFMFPVKAGGKVFYLYGAGQEAIRDGELFRAVVNGRRV